MTTIKATSIRAFELFDAEENSLGLFQVVDSWEHMLKLESASDPDIVVIVNAPSPIGDVFASLARHRIELTVFKASPDLLMKVMK